MDSNGMKIARAHFGTLPSGFEVLKYTLQKSNRCLAYTVDNKAICITEV